MCADICRSARNGAKTGQGGSRLGSAKALAVILGESLSGAPLDQVAQVSQDVVHRIFGDELSMGKSMGLMGMVSMIRNAARQALGSRQDFASQST